VPAGLIGASRGVQVWALAVGGAGEGLLATGASDATVAVWEDCTAADDEEAAAEEAAIVLKQQDLSNALQVGVIANILDVILCHAMKSVICVNNEIIDIHEVLTLPTHQPWAGEPAPCPHPSHTQAL
jgi:hypothetical protein